eukprot:766097_1
MRIQSVPQTLVLSFNLFIQAQFVASCCLPLLWQYKLTQNLSKFHPSRKSLRDLQEILNDPMGKELYREFLRMEFARENLKFYECVEEFKLSYDVLDDTAHSREAMKIYQTFIAEDSPELINMDYTIIEQLRQCFPKVRAKPSSSFVRVLPKFSVEKNVFAE